MKHEIDNNRLYWIDAIRSFACLCVITVHAAVPGGTKGLYMLGPVNYFTASGASILFFMISGALVLYKPRPFGPFIKQRLSRIVLPMVIWTLISLLLYCCRGLMLWNELPRKILLIPFYPQYGTYWFIYVIFGIYLLTPIVTLWLEKCKRKELEVILAIGAFALSIPYFTYLFGEDLRQSLDKTYGWLYYFGGFMWYALMGYYLRKHVNILYLKLYHYIIFVILLILPLLLYQTRIPHDIIQNRMSINMAMLCCAYFIFIKHLRLNDLMKRAVYNFAQHSFGIYLIHMQVMNLILEPLLIERYDIHYAVIIPVTVILNALISYCIVHFISKLPYSKYIVGL